MTEYRPNHTPLSPKPPASVRSRAVSVLRHDALSVQVTDSVAVEEPFEIRLDDTPLAVVMRTPGDDEDLVRGFLLSEGIALSPDELMALDLLDDSRLRVRFKAGVDIDAAQFQRSMFMSSSCGVCGKTSIENVQLVARPAPEFVVSRSVLATLTERLRQHQPTFDATGGLHAAGLFDLAGRPLAVREDVGRHNAVDKVVGSVAAQQWPLPPSVLVVSGRQSFEIVQKAGVVGIGALVGVSAPSSLAVELATSLGMLLVGFSRGTDFNVYAGSARLGQEG